MLMSLLIFTLYRIIALPLALLMLPLITIFLRDKALKEKLRQMRQVRKNSNWVPLPARPIWVHAASGEIEYAKPILREIRSTWPSLPILLTYFSPSGLAAQMQISEADLRLPLPWDQRKQMKAFINFYKPLCCLIARTDVWPEMSHQNHQAHIPQLLFAATFTPQSQNKKSSLARALALWSFQNLDRIHAVSEADREALKDLGVTRPIEVRGDTRYVQARFRLAHPRPLPKALQKSQRLTLVAGSTWPEDEDVLLRGLNSWIRAGHLVLLAPHEVNEDHLKKFEEKARMILGEHSQTQRLSRLDKITDDISIVIIDQVGILAETYSLADIAFVGGSFREKVHSVIEPLAASLPVLVGPLISNNREALYFKKIPLQSSAASFLVNSVENSTEMEARLTELMGLLEKNRSVFQLQIAAEYSEKSSQSVQAVIEWLTPLVEFDHFQNQRRKMPHSII
jgi:3-deoxy-D-manno-octulosonic-acid transferase